LCILETEGVERGKIYRVKPDAFAREHKQLRIIDDSQEDYLFPAANFVGLTLPKAAEKHIGTPIGRAAGRKHNF
jgi:hypothetical protein